MGREREESIATKEESPAVAAASVSADVPSDYSEAITVFIERRGAVQTFNPQHNVDDSFSNLIGGVLKVTSIEKGKISCFLDVKAPTLVPLSADFPEFIAFLLVATPLIDYLESILNVESF